MQMRPGSDEKYRKVPRAKEPSPPDEIRVTGIGYVCNYVTYTAKVLNENHNSITIRATGKAVSIAVSVAEVVKRRFKGLHQLTTVGCTQLVNEYEPIEEGLDKIQERRTVSFISIQLARDEKAEELDKTAPGYQEPIDESLVKELDPSMVSHLTRPRGRGRGRGRGFFNRGAAPFLRGRGRGGGGGGRGKRNGSVVYPIEGQAQQNNQMPAQFVMEQPAGGYPPHNWQRIMRGSSYTQRGVPQYYGMPPDRNYQIPAVKNMPHDRGYHQMPAERGFPSGDRVFSPNPRGFQAGNYGPNDRPVRGGRGTRGGRGGGRGGVRSTRWHGGESDMPHYPNN